MPPAHADNKRLRVLDPQDRAAIYDRPMFTTEEREGYFTPTPPERVLMETFTEPPLQAFFILLLGYFKAKQRLFTVTLAEVLPDLHWISDHLDLGVAPEAFRIPHAKTIHQQRKHILTFTGYRRCQPADRQQAFHIALQAARVSPKVPYLLRILLRHFATAKIILPAYTTLQEQLIGKALTAEEHRLETLLTQHLTPEDRDHLALLFDREAGRYRVTLLRQVPRTLGPRALARERKRAAQLHPLDAIALRILPLLALSPDAQTAYAGMVSYYGAAGLHRLTTDLVNVYLLCFIRQRTRRLHDHLLSGVMREVKAFQEDAKANAQERVVAYRLQRSRDMAQAGRILQLFTTNAVAATTPFVHVQAQAFAILDRDRLDHIAHYIATGADCDETAFFWERIDARATTIKRRLRRLLAGITLVAPYGHSPLLDAVHHMQRLGTGDRSFTKAHSKTLPTRWIPVRLKRYLYAQPSTDTARLLVDRYEALLYLQLRTALEAGELVCPDSIRFRSLEDDLIPLAEWQANKATLITEANLPTLRLPIREHLTDLEQELEAQFARVNGRIAAGENPAIQITQHGTTRTWTLTTPPPREQPNHRIYERLPQASLIQVLAAVHDTCGFMHDFDHMLGRAHHQRDDRVVMAGLIAWGTNVGLHRMGEMSDIPPSTLVRASGNYLRLETLQAASTRIINTLAAMPLFRAYDIDGQRHSSSDGQKFTVAIDTLKAQHSPRYFGMGKGVVADTLVLNHVPVNTLLISAHDPESDDVFDLLYNNPTTLQSTIHSTDTHGTNRVNFAILSMFGHRFAPRYANVQERMRTSLYGFQPPAAYGDDALFRPVRKLNTDLIISEWDAIQRIMVSLSRKTISQRLLIAKLSASKRRNRTLQALWEYDHIFRSCYLLEFVDSPRLRQNVQQALNRGEQYHHLKRALTAGNIGKLRYVTDEEQALWNEACRLLVNAILLYNMQILQQAIDTKTTIGMLADSAFLRTVSPVAWHHINFGGRLTFLADLLPAPILASVAAVLAYRPSAADQPPDPEDEYAMIADSLDDPFAQEE